MVLSHALLSWLDAAHMMRLHSIVVDRCFFERLCDDAPAPPAAGAKEFRLRRVGRNTLSAIMRLGRAKAQIDIFFLFSHVTPPSAMRKPWNSTTSSSTSCRLRPCDIFCLRPFVWGLQILCHIYLKYIHIFVYLIQLFIYTLVRSCINKCTKPNQIPNYLWDIWKCLVNG